MIDAGARRRREAIRQLWLGSELLRSVTESARRGTGAVERLVERGRAVSPCDVRFLGIRVRHLHR
jgi:hypothetical protein